MAFKRDGTKKFESQRRWTLWLVTHHDLVERARLSESILRSESDWWDFVEHTYHPMDPDDALRFVRYDASELDHNQAEALWRLILAALEALIPDHESRYPWWKKNLELTYRPI